MLRKKLQGYVGFANLPNQVHRKSVKKGFQFTCMVVGMYYIYYYTIIHIFYLFVFLNPGSTMCNE